ncbi:8635_t:CDS:2, partial [Acaulospora morrowiae]
MAIIDISNTDIYIICNEDIQLISLITSNLHEKGATKVHLLVSNEQSQYVKETFIGANVNAIGGVWEKATDYEVTIKNAVIVISMLYHEFEKQEKLFAACVRQNVVLFVAWDSGMELESLVRNKMCPRTRLHQMLIDYTLPLSHESYPSPQTDCYTQSSFVVSSESSDKTQWMLFQVGIFSDEILIHDISTITTAFNSPNQFIFVNVSIKSDFAQLVAEAIVTRKVKVNRNYVIGEFVSHTFLGHVHKVFNSGLKYDDRMSSEISEFEMNNMLRISGIISARPIPRILYPNCGVYVHKLCVEISFQHEATIYEILTNHRQ